MKIAIAQMPVTADKKMNVKIASTYIREAATGGAKLVILPEMFCCPYDNEAFPVYAESRGGFVYSAMQQEAKKNRITLIAGSMPEKDCGSLYNTSFVFDQNGNEIAHHRKAHLFDIDIAGGQYFKESDVLSPGGSSTVFRACGHRFGLAICFDIRFPELFRKMTLDGAEAIFVPAAFNMTTGPAHWELTFRARALDNQIYTVGAAPARDEQAGYVSYANSIVCSPWGDVTARAAETPALLYAELDFDKVAQIREQLPLLSARRPELY